MWTEINCFGGLIYLGAQCEDIFSETLAQLTKIL